MGEILNVQWQISAFLSLLFLCVLIANVDQLVRAISLIACPDTAP